MAMSNIVLTDVRPTPTNHTFVPASPQVGNTPARWYNKLTGLSSKGWEVVTTLVSLATSQKQEHRLNVTVEQPKVVIVDGEEIYKGSVRFYGTIICPYGLNTDDNIKEICALGTDAIGEAQVQSVLKDQQPSA
jgi:hypothetical protein